MNNISIAQAIRQTKEKIIELLNNSGLPIDVMDMLLGELKMIVHNQAESEYQAEIMKQEKTEEIDTK